MATPSPRIVLYNHKGGVGKTTLTINIAAALSALGKKVLLVDSDPQCNLTSHLVEESVVDRLMDQSETKRGRTLWTAMKPIVEAEGSFREIEPYETYISNVFLVPGDIRLAEYESLLHEFWGDCLQRRTKGFRGTTALSALVTEIVKKYKIDYVFYDTGPNIGPLNRIILLDSDYFIVPVACDVFSIRALKSLGHQIREWVRNWETLENLAPDEVPLLTGEPKFLGYIPQRFKTYGGTISTESLPLLAQIEKTLYSDVVSVLHSHNPKLANASMSGIKLGEVKEFTSLVQKSQKQGLALWQTIYSADYQKSEAHAAFERIAKAIIRKAPSGGR